MRTDAIHRGCLAGLVALALTQCVDPEPPARLPERTKDPAPSVERLVRDYKARDPDASFTYVSGNVDSFATSGKPTVPDYALPILKKHALPDRARPVGKLGDFVQAPLGQGPRATDRATASRPPTSEIRAREGRASIEILKAFLQQNDALFGAGSVDVDGDLREFEFTPGAQFRTLRFNQHVDGEKVLYGETLAQFDTNWNVVGVSRMIVTPRKLYLSPASVAKDRGVSRDAAIRAASLNSPDPACRSRHTTIVRADRSIDLSRGLRVWDIELAAPDGPCHWRVVVDAANAEVLNVSDLIDYAHTDAKVNRWRFPAGDISGAQQVVSFGQYTRDDQRLEHDFFFVMNDHRCDGAAETACPSVSFTTNRCELAYGKHDGASSIRATRRTDRNFSSYFPNGSSETFGETNAYYWARQFMLWLRPSLDANGVLPSSTDDYKRVVIVTNTCRTRSVHSNVTKLTTHDDIAEDVENTILLAHRDPAVTSLRNVACEGGACYDNPSNLHHELNHFILHRYYDIGSTLDCGGDNELKYIHEGMLGTVVPHAFWQSHYGVSYNPSSSRLYFSDSTVGRVHVDASSRMVMDDYPCKAGADAYSSGRVGGQPLWEIYHGVNVSNAGTTGMWRPGTTTLFNTLVYLSASVVSSSSYKDRYEFANRLMELIDKHSNLPSDQKRVYCEVFEHHGLRAFINDDYCS